MGGGLPVDGESEGAEDRIADETVAASATGERWTSLAFSARRARLASRARLSSSPRRKASITAGPAGPDGVTEDCGRGGTFPVREVAAFIGLEPGRPRARVQPPPESDPSTSCVSIGEVWVSASARTAAAGCGAADDAGPGGAPGPDSFRPNDCSRAIS